MRTYILHVLIALDQLVNALIGGLPDETLSSAAYRSHRQGYFWGRVWMPVLDWVFLPLDGPKHCYRAYLSEKFGNQNFRGYE
jgi:hypothetical protein